MSLFADAPFEIEFRCRFAGEGEAFATLPFLRPSLQRTVPWTDTYYGLEVFQRGEVLRYATVVLDGRTRYMLGWKGSDAGTFANLRRELNEDVTDGIAESAILAAFTSRTGPAGRAEIVPALENAGLGRFMSYEGVSSTGRHDGWGLNTKVMHCESIRWPLLVELEKVAATESEARACEHELLDLCSTYRLEDHVVREEPGTLLYERVFGTKPRFLSA